MIRTRSKDESLSLYSGADGEASSIHGRQATATHRQLSQRRKLYNQPISQSINQSINHEALSSIATSK